MNAPLLDELRDRVTRQKTHSYLVIRNGQCVFEYYRNRKIQSKPHNIYSVTKSVISALIGICLEQRLIPSLDTPVLDYFPTFAAREQDPLKRSITLDHLLTMTPGYHWPELREWNATPRMQFAPHWVRFVLERPLECAPGERMNYISGASHLLAAIVQRVTGMKVAAFADKHLFRPLGITQYHWHEDPQGISNGGFGLAMLPVDLAKFGYLYLHEGRWGGKQIVPQEWVVSSTIPRYLTYEKIGHYARHWWVGALDQERELAGANRFYFAMGLAGQFIIVVPSANLVVTATSELYDQTLLPLHLFRQYVVPALPQAD